MKKQLFGAFALTIALWGFHTKPSETVSFEYPNMKSPYQFRFGDSGGFAAANAKSIPYVNGAFYIKENSNPEIKLDRGDFNNTKPGSGKYFYGAGQQRLILNYSTGGGQDQKWTFVPFTKPEDVKNVQFKLGDTGQYITLNEGKDVSTQIPHIDGNLYFKGGGLASGTLSRNEYKTKVPVSVGLYKTLKSGSTTTYVYNITVKYSIAGVTSYQVWTLSSSGKTWTGPSSK